MPRWTRSVDESAVNADPHVKIEDVPGMPNRRLAVLWAWGREITYRPVRARWWEDVVMKAERVALDLLSELKADLRGDNDAQTLRVIRPEPDFFTDVFPDEPMNLGRFGPDRGEPGRIRTSKREPTSPPPGGSGVSMSDEPTFAEREATRELSRTVLREYLRSANYVLPLTGVRSYSEMVHGVDRVLRQHTVLRIRVDLAKVDSPRMVDVAGMIVRDMMERQGLTLPEELRELLRGSAERDLRDHAAVPDGEWLRKHDEAMTEPGQPVRRTRLGSEFVKLGNDVGHAEMPVTDEAHLIELGLSDFPVSVKSRCPDCQEPMSCVVDVKIEGPTSGLGGVAGGAYRIVARLDPEVHICRRADA